jgi:hypothetical protein
MGRERFLFLPFPRPVGPPYGILTYPDGRVGVIHPSAWKWNSTKFERRGFSELLLWPRTSMLSAGLPYQASTRSQSPPTTSALSA